MNKLVFVLLLAVTLSAQLMAQQDIPTNQDSINSGKEITDEGICAYIPIYFTPNRDGINDEWLLKSSGANKCFLTVWNNNNICGTVIANKEITINECGVTKLWDNGIGSDEPQCDEGGFEYIIDLKNTNTGETRRFEGNISIIH